MSLYEVLKASKLGGGAPDYWTELFARRVAGGWTVSTITGVLPLTFTAKGGTAVDWVIEGNNDVGENLYGVNASVSISTVSAVCSGSEIAIESDGTNTTVSATMAIWKNNLSVNLSAGSYGYKIERTGTTTGIISSIYDANNTSIGSSQMSGTFTLPADTSVYMGFYIPANTTASGAIKLIITAGSTAPDHYIPYQQGVGERTENLLGTSLFTDGRTVDGAGAIVYNRFRTATVDAIDVNSNTAYLSWVTDVNDVSCIVSGYDENDIYIGRSFESPGAVINTSDYRKVRFTFYTNTSGYVLEISKIDNLIFIEGSTPPSEYIPYGYQIPLIVSQAGQPNKNYDIYIGDSPLTEGETVSKTSTGVDIELFEGENVVSTTLYNKPTMEIKYL